jgi:hypothetical protein
MTIPFPPNAVKKVVDQSSLRLANFGCCKRGSQIVVQRCSPSLFIAHCGSSWFAVVVYRPLWIVVVRRRRWPSLAVVGGRWETS